MILGRSLEVEPQRKLQFAHGGSTFYIGNLSVVASRHIRAVNAWIGAVISTECVHRVIKDVERIHAELSFDPLGDGDVLHQGEVGIKS